MTTDKTQELDGIMDKIYDLAYDHLPDRGIAIGTVRIKKAILDWHNKQMGAVLDRLEGRARGAFDYEADIEEYAEDVLTSIEAERNRLNPSKSTPFNKPKESSND